MPVPNPMSRLPALRRVPIFRGLAKSTLFDVARKTHEETYPAGTIVVREGDPGDALCIIVRGTVEVQVRGEAVAQMAAGEYFGEIALFDGKPRSATVVAVDDVHLLRLESSDFEELLDIPYVARNALESLAQRVREAHDARDAREA